MILLYIYFIVLILLYVFLQLNYMFVWFQKLMFDDAGDSVFFGLIVCIIWPMAIFFFLGVKLALYMDDIHNKHKNK